MLDIAAGAPLDDDGAPTSGSIWILFLQTNGRVRAHQKISLTEGGFGSGLEYFDEFGNEIAQVGDLDRDGVVDLAVGVRNDDDGGENRGGLYLLYLRTDGTVKRKLKISQTAGGFGGTLRDEDRLGTGISAIGDVDGDGLVDLAVGASRDDDTQFDAGAVWVLFLDLAVGPVASVSSRNGSGSNRVGFTSATPPALGTPWSASVDTGPAGAQATTLVALFDRPVAGLVVPPGEVLVTGKRLLDQRARCGGGHRRPRPGASARHEPARLELPRSGRSPRPPGSSS